MKANQRRKEIRFFGGKQKTNEKESYGEAEKSALYVPIAQQVRRLSR